MKKILLSVLILFLNLCAVSQSFTDTVNYEYRVKIDSFIQIEPIIVSLSNMDSQNTILLLNSDTIQITNVLDPIHTKNRSTYGYGSLNTDSEKIWYFIEKVIDGNTALILNVLMDPSRSTLWSKYPRPSLKD